MEEEELKRLRLSDVAEELEEAVDFFADYLEVVERTNFPSSNEATFVVQLSHWRLKTTLRYRVTITPEIPELGNEEKGAVDA